MFCHVVCIYMDKTCFLFFPGKALVVLKMYSNFEAADQKLAADTYTEVVSPRGLNLRGKCSGPQMAKRVKMWVAVGVGQELPEAHPCSCFGMARNGCRALKSQILQGPLVERCWGPVYALDVVVDI